MCGPGGVRQLISEEGLVPNNTIRSDTILRIELRSLQCAEGTIDKFGMRLIGLLPNSADPWPRRRASPVCEMWDVCGSSSKSVLAFFDLLLWLDLNYAYWWCTKCFTCTNTLWFCILKSLQNVLKSPQITQEVPKSVHLGHIFLLGLA